MAIFIPPVTPHFICNIVVRFHSPGGVSTPTVPASGRPWPCFAKAAKGPLTRHPAACHTTAGGECC